MLTPAQDAEVNTFLLSADKAFGAMMREFEFLHPELEGLLMLPSNLQVVDESRSIHILNGTVYTPDSYGGDSTKHRCRTTRELIFKKIQDRIP